LSCQGGDVRLAQRLADVHVLARDAVLAGRALDQVVELIGVEQVGVAQAPITTVGPGQLDLALVATVGHLIEGDLDPILVGGRDTVLPELRQTVPDVAGQVGALGIPSPVRGQGHLPIERRLGLADACRDLALGALETDMDAVLDRLAASGDRAGRGASVQQPLHDPERRLGRPEVQGRGRQMVDAMALEAAAHRGLLRQRPAGRRRRHRSGSVGLVCRALVLP
jgi:hypothetical protein